MTVVVGPGLRFGFGFGGGVGFGFGSGVAEPAYATEPRYFVAGVSPLKVSETFSVAPSVAEAGAATGRGTAAQKAVFSGDGARRV